MSCSLFKKKIELLNYYPFSTYNSLTSDYFLAKVKAIGGSNNFLPVLVDPKFMVPPSCSHDKTCQVVDFNYVVCTRVSTRLNRS